MARNLVILPFNTELEKDKIHRLGQLIVPAFRGQYDGFEILDHEYASHTQGSDVFAPDVVLGTYTLLNGIPGVGVHRNFGNYLDGNHGLVITDMMISFGGYRAGGTADESNGTALVTTKEMPTENKRDLELVISRLLGVSLHEIGHLYGLEHHDAEVSPRRYCPMINRTWDDPEFETERTRAKFLDSIGRGFCEDCYKTIESK